MTEAPLYSSVTLSSVLHSGIHPRVSAVLCGASGEHIRSLSRNTKQEFRVREAMMWVSDKAPKHQRAIAEPLERGERGGGEGSVNRQTLCDEPKGKVKRDEGLSINWCGFLGYGSWCFSSGDTTPCRMTGSANTHEG